MLEHPTADQIYDIIVNEFTHNEYFIIDHFYYFNMYELHEIFDFIYTSLKNFKKKKMFELKYTIK